MTYFAIGLYLLKTFENFYYFGLYKVPVKQFKAHRAAPSRSQYSTGMAPEQTLAEHRTSTLADTIRPGKITALSAR